MGCFYLQLGAREALSNDFGFEGAPLVHREPLVVLGEARLTLLVHHQNEAQHPGDWKSLENSGTARFLQNVENNQKNVYFGAECRR